jgi:hypothetical protein
LQVNNVTPITPESAPEDVIYIYDGKRRWWGERRIKMLVAIALLVGLLIGVFVGIITSHELNVKASPFYREAVQRGDAALAMLSQVAAQLEALGHGKRVIIADDLQRAKEAIGIVSKGRVVSTEV